MLSQLERSLTQLTFWCFIIAVGNVPSEVASAAAASVVSSVNETAGIASECCQLGRQWAMHSQLLCSPYPREMSPVAIALTDDVTQASVCVASIDTCCVLERRRIQCDAGKHTAVHEQSCHALHRYQAAEDAKECCNCCRLAVVVTLLLRHQPCDRQASAIMSPFLSDSVHCRQSFVECCRMLSMHVTGDDRAVKLLPVPVSHVITVAPQQRRRNTTRRKPRTTTVRSTTTVVTSSSIRSSFCEHFRGQLCAHLCIDTPESYLCACHDGFTLLADGKSCRSVTRPPTTPSTSTAPSCPDGGIWNVEANQCDMPLVITVKPHEETDIGKPIDGSCPTVGGRNYKFNKLTGNCEEVAADGGLVRSTRPSPRNLMSSSLCPNGYGWNRLNRQCEDLDECVIGLHSCYENQQCENIEGSYRCHDSDNNDATGDLEVIYSDVQLAGSDDDISDSDLQPTPTTATATTATATTTTMSIIYGNNPRHSDTARRQRLTTTVRPPRVMTSSVASISEASSQQSLTSFVDSTFDEKSDNERKSCESGFEFDAELDRCTDVNECQQVDPEMLCGLLRNCVNTVGSYECVVKMCPNGYQLDHQTGSCRLITCHPGLRPDASGNCIDIDECLQKVCPHTATCENNEGSYRCICREGFEPVDYRDTTSNIRCQDVNECEQRGLCHHSCQNTYGSYNCQCDEGYELASDQRICDDIDECELFANRSTPLCQGICGNTPGSFVCTCPTGYQLSSDGRTCRDIDECYDSSSSDVTNCHGTDDVCVNTRGDFRCVTIACPKGFLRTAPAAQPISSIRCQRRTFTCAQGDVECLYAPLSYSANFISLPLVAALIVPIELFTMRGPVAPSRRMQFELELVSAVVQPSTNSQRSATDGRVAGYVTRNYFDVDQVRPTEAVVKLVQTVSLAQDVELKLNMNVYSSEFSGNEIFYGTAVARIFIFFTSDPW